MTIRKGEDWGEPLGEAPAPSVAAGSDADAARALWEHLQGRGPGGGVRVLGGSLFDMVGGRGKIRYRYPVDLGVVALPGGEQWPFVASLVVHSRSWRRGTALMNAQSVGRLRLGHRSHPNDGRLDLVTWSLRLGELLEVARRARLGDHTPHPGIVERRVTDQVEIPVGPHGRVLLDGVHITVKRPCSIVARVIADAGFVVS